MNLLLKRAPDKSDQYTAGVNMLSYYLMSTYPISNKVYTWNLLECNDRMIEEDIEIIEKG